MTAEDIERIYKLWRNACEAGATPDDAIAFLIDAAALGLVTNGFDVGAGTQRLRQSFAALKRAERCWITAEGKPQ